MPAKRKTSFRVPPLIDYQLGELCDKWEMTATEVIAVAVDRLYRSQRWGLSAEQMGLSTLMYTLLHDRLTAAGVRGSLDLGLALAWCQRWLGENADPDALASDQWPDALTTSAWAECSAAADAAAAAWGAR